MNVQAAWHKMKPAQMAALSIGLVTAFSLTVGLLVVYVAPMLGGVEIVRRYTPGDRVMVFEAGSDEVAVESGKLGVRGTVPSGTEGVVISDDSTGTGDTRPVRVNVRIGDDLEPAEVEARHLRPGE